MVMSSESPKEFSSLNGTNFQLYLGTITYQVALADYTQFILRGADSNELIAFLRKTSRLQERLSLIRDEYNDRLIKVDTKNHLESLFPEELKSFAREGFERLAIRVNEIKVVDLKFVEGSVKGKIQIVLAGTLIYLSPAADFATVMGIDIADFAYAEKNRMQDQVNYVFGDIQNQDGGIININYYNDADRPPDMQTYFREPDNVKEDVGKCVTNKLSIPRPPARP